MNINTNAFLNTLLTKVDSTLKAKIEKLSVDGKIDLSTVVKEKGIQTLLGQLFKEISSGTKNKTEVVSLLENSKHSLKFKNISNDIKQIITLMKSELKNTPELGKFTSVLKNSLLDIKNIDEKILKSTFQNSGVFLESKLAKSNDSVSQNLKNLLGQLHEKLKILQNVDKIAVNTLNIKSEKTTMTLSEIKTDTQVSKNSTLLSDIQKGSDLEKITNLKSEVKNDIKLDVQNILKKLEIASQPQNKLELQLNSLKMVGSDIKVLEEKFVQQNIKNDITTNLKEAVLQIKNNILISSFLGLNKTILLIKNQLENIKSNNISEIKSEITKIDTKIETLNNEKNIDLKSNTVKELIQQTTKVIDRIQNSNIQELLKNNLGILKNISGDLKNIMLQVKETLELQNNSETISKELKNNVDKLLSQIDFYQLSSYSSNSNHSYISFLQDDLDDVDIKFNNVNNDEFSCLIHLSLKEKGNLKILLQLDKKNSLIINIGVEQKEFKEMIQNSLQKLRKQINSLGLLIINLNIFDLDKDIEKSNELKAYGDNQNLDFGLDIKV